MDKYITELITLMYAELQRIAVNSENILQQAQRSFYHVETVIRQLKDFIAAHPFKDLAEEIQFFKILKPQFQKELIYFEQLLYLETNSPVAPLKAKKQYYQRELSRIQAYFEKNNYFYNYYRLGEQQFDERYYVRNSPQIPLLPVSFSDIDTSFSTPYSYKLAKLQAFEQLKDYVNTRLINKERPEDSTGHLTKKRRKVTWTGPKAAAEEFILAWDAKGYVNYGENSLKELTEAFEECFNIRLGNIYRSFLGMAIRKKGYTPHLDSSKEALEDKIKEKHQ